MKELTKADVIVITEEILEAIAHLEAKHGIKLTNGGGRYDDTSATIRLKMVLANAPSQTEVDYKRYWAMWERNGLVEEDLGNVFTVRGTQYKFAGYKTRNRRYPFVGLRLKDGASFKFEDAPAIIAAIIAGRDGAK